MYLVLSQIYEAYAFHETRMGVEILKARRIRTGLMM